MCMNVLNVFVPNFTDVIFSSIMYSGYVYNTSNMLNGVTYVLTCPYFFDVLYVLEVPSCLCSLRG